MNDDGWWNTRRTPPTPIPVWIDLVHALPPRRMRMSQVPLRVRSAGIDNSATVPGELLAWHQTTTGDWWALTRFTATNRTEKAHLDLTQLVPARSVRPRS